MSTADLFADPDLIAMRKSMESGQAGGFEIHIGDSACPNLLVIDRCETGWDGIGYYRPNGEWTGNREHASTSLESAVHWLCERADAHFAILIKFDAAKTDIIERFGRTLNDGTAE